MLITFFIDSSFSISLELLLSSLPNVFSSLWPQTYTLPVFVKIIEWNLNCCLPSSPDEPDELVPPPAATSRTCPSTLSSILEGNGNTSSVEVLTSNESLFVPHTYKLPSFFNASTWEMPAAIFMMFEKSFPSASTEISVAYTTSLSYPLFSISFPPYWPLPSCP